MKIESPHQCSRKRATLMEEERRLFLALCTIRTQLNSQAPIACLPLDIIERVFAHCMEDIHQQKYPLAFTKVCSFWRNVRCLFSQVFD